MLTVVSLVPVRGADPPPLTRLLAQAGDYVRRFEQDFALVVSDEDYRQHARGRRYIAPLHRRTRAEMLFMWLPDGAVWLTVRNVLTKPIYFISQSMRRLRVRMILPTVLRQNHCVAVRWPSRLSREPNHTLANCRANGSTPGVDGETFARIDAYGVEPWLGALREEVRTGRYRGIEGSSPRSTTAQRRDARVARAPSRTSPRSWYAWRPRTRPGATLASAAG